MKRLLRFCCLLVSLVPLTALSMVQESLPGYKIDTRRISVSGISSGGYMAQQFHVAYSNMLIGAGIVAGGPYYCAEDSITIALTRCMDPTQADLPDPDRLAWLTRTFADQGRIDPVSGMAGDQVWLYSSVDDETVHHPVMNALAEYYRRFVPNSQIVYVDDHHGAHAMPTDDYGYPCDHAGSSTNTDDYFINDCDYDAAGALLQDIYRRMKAPTNTLSGQFVKFPQDEFINAPESHGMGQYGYAYVPMACSNGAPCGIHVAFHGCLQYADRIGEVFVRHAGYNEWADSNKLIVLYPQAYDSLNEGNGNGCWDWWGYDDADYAFKNGRQMRAVRAMISRLESGSDGTLSPPPAPTGVSVLSQNGGTVTLGWAGSPEASGYQVFTSLVSGGPYLQVNAQAITDQQVTVDNLEPGDHYFVIVAVDPSGLQSGPSQELVVTVPGI